MAKALGTKVKPNVLLIIIFEETKSLETAIQKFMLCYRYKKQKYNVSVQYGAHYTISTNFAGYTACSSLTNKRV